MKNHALFAVLPANAMVVLAVAATKVCVLKSNVGPAETVVWSNWSPGTGTPSMRIPAVLVSLASEWVR